MADLNFGIIGAEFYIPSLYISQEELESLDNVSKGKYTIGLGQQEMAVVGNNEDVISMSLTVTDALLSKFNVNPCNVGRLEVGSESNVDRSKSIKSHLMKLFPGNHDICGVDNINACYGGTAALLNSLAWLESAEWDGRVAIVVMTDISVYERGPARPTGGAGTIALLLGPNAPLIIERDTIAYYMDHCYDFYKPIAHSEYPIVDGPLSVESFLTALHYSYTLHLSKLEKKKRISHCSPSLKDFVHVIFHSPYRKLVHRAFSRLFYSDHLRDSSIYPELESFSKTLGFRDSLGSAELNVALSAISKNEFMHKVEPTRLIGDRIGNSYCSSLYFGLLSLLANRAGNDLVGKRIGMFSYGSGLASCFYSITVKSDPSSISPSLKDINNILNNRTCLSGQEYSKLMEQRKEDFLNPRTLTIANNEGCNSNVYYLQSIDEKYRRSYCKYSL